MLGTAAAVREQRHAVRDYVLGRGEAHLPPHVQPRVPRVLRPEYPRLHVGGHLVLIVAVGAEVGLVGSEAVVDGLEVVPVVHQLLRGREVPLPRENRLLREPRLQPLLQ